MTDDILFALWFFLPAGVANVTPIILAKTPLIKNWNYPFDCNLHFRGQRLMGDHKTWRGIIGGVIAGTLVLWLQTQLYVDNQPIRDFVPLNYAEISVIGLGFLLSFGALLGDAIKSFFKRRLEVPTGRSWFPFDQLDYIIGGLLLSGFLVHLPTEIYIWVVVLWFGLHLISSYVGYLLKFKDNPI